VKARSGEYWDGSGLQGLKYLLERMKAVLQKRTPDADAKQAMSTTRKPPWRKSNPKKRAGTSRKLTGAQKRSARSTAKKAGRRYPNLVDNMRAASKRKSR